MSNKLVLNITISILMLFYNCCITMAKEPPPTPINVLILSSYHAEGNETIHFMNGLHDELNLDNTVSVQYYTEYMDLLRFKGDEYKTCLLNLYRQKYQNIKIDIIISHAYSSLDFLLDYQSELFPNCPVVYTLASESIIPADTIPDNYIGIISEPDFSSTLDIALTCCPETEHVLIIGGTSPTDKQYINTAKKQLTSYEDRVTITYSNTFAMNDLLKQVSTLDKNSIIIYSQIQQDGKGERLLPCIVSKQIARIANVPVFNISEAHLSPEHSLVGGKVISPEQVGRTAAKTALNIIHNNTLPEHLITPPDSHSYIFDWRAIQRWKIDDHILPAESQFRFKELSYWEQFSIHFICIALLLFIETLLITILFINRSRRLKAEKYFRESEERFRTLVENIPGASYRCLIDKHWTMLFISKEIETISGYPSTDFIQNSSRSYASIIHPEDVAKVEKLAMGAVTYRSMFTVEYRIIRADGQLRWVFEKGQGIYNDHQKAICLDGVIIDITDRKNAEEKKEELINELEQKNTELERFTYTVSHDLKSPLVTISGFIGVLDKDIQNNNVENIKTDIFRIKSAATTMSQLLDELLELSRIGRIANPSVAVNIYDLCGEIKEQFNQSLHEKHAQLHIQPDLPIVFGDRQRIREIFQNLIENAIKYRGDQPSPTIEIGSKQVDDKTIIYVKDNGIGIESKHTETIFGLFNQLDQTIDGTGVGLAIVKRIVEIHNGKIWVESEGENKGSTFCLTLPIKAP